MKIANKKRKNNWIYMVITAMRANHVKRKGKKMMKKNQERWQKQQAGTNTIMKLMNFLTLRTTWIQKLN
jgi:hypothetical protein